MRSSLCAGSSVYRRCVSIRAGPSAPIASVRLANFILSVTSVKKLFRSLPVWATCLPPRITGEDAGRPCSPSKFREGFMRLSAVLSKVFLVLIGGFFYW